MSNNSERSKQWRNKRKNDPMYRESERKRKQESRKNRTEEQRKRDRDQCKARQHKYRERRKRKFSKVGSEDSDEDRTSDSSDVSASSVTRSQDPIVSYSVKQADGNRSSSIDDQSSEVSANLLGSDDDNVVVDVKASDSSCHVVISERDSQPADRGNDLTNPEPLNDVTVQTGNLRNHLHNPVPDLSLARGKLKSDLGVVPKQDSCDVIKGVDGNSLPVPPKEDCASNKVLHDELSVTSDTDSHLDDMEDEMDGASEQPNESRSASETGIGIDRKVKGTADQSNESVSETGTGIVGKVKGTADLSNESVSETGTGIVGKVKGTVALSNESVSETGTGVVGKVKGTADQANESVSETGTGIDRNVECISEQPNGPVSGLLVAASIGRRGSVSVPAEELRTGSHCERPMVLNSISTHSSLSGKKTTKWIQQYAEGENHEVVRFLTNDVTSPVVSQRQTFFVRLQSELSQITDFDELKSRCGEVSREIEKLYPMPAIPTLSRFGHQRDVTASSLYPPDAPRDHVPIRIVGDGNCLPRVGSLFAFGNELRHHEIRVRIFIELCRFEDTYLNDSYLNRGLDANNQTKRTATLIAQYSDVFTKDVHGPDRDKYIYRVNTKNVLIPGSYNGMWSVFALASVIGVRVRSIYPDYGGHNVREDHNRMILPRVSHNSQTVIHIMWTNTSGKEPLASVWTPNHFVAVLHENKMDNTPPRLVGTTEGNRSTPSVDLTSSGPCDAERPGLSRDYGLLPPHIVARFRIPTSDNTSVTAPPSVSIISTRQRPFVGSPVARNEDACLSHSSEKPVYLCNTCKGRPICYKCPLDGHTNHEYEDLKAHLEKKESEYVQKALRKRVSALQMELNKQKLNNRAKIGKIALDIDARVAAITQQLQRWRQQCRQKLQDDGQAIHNNITLSGARVAATQIPNYISNLQQQLRRLNATERLARMSEEPPSDVAVNTNQYTGLQFVPGNNDQLRQQFGSLSCTLPDTQFGSLSCILPDTSRSSTGAITNTFTGICNSLAINPVDRCLQSRTVTATSNHVTQKSGSEDMDDAISTSRGLLPRATSLVANNTYPKQRVDTQMNRTTNVPTPSKRPRAMPTVAISTEPTQKLERQLDISPNVSVVSERPCAVPVVSAMDGEEQKTMKRPNVEVCTTATRQHIDVSPNPVTSCSATRAPNGQQTNASRGHTGSSGMQTPIEPSTCVEINQTPRTTETQRVILDNVLPSQRRTTAEYISRTCLARALRRVNTGTSSNSNKRTPQANSKPAPGTTATTQKISELVAGRRSVSTESSTNRTKAGQMRTQPPTEKTRMECTNATGLKMVIRRSNTANESGPTPRVNKGSEACAIPFVPEPTTAINSNVDGATTNVAGMTQKCDANDEMTCAMNTTHTVGTIQRTDVNAGNITPSKPLETIAKANKTTKEAKVKVSESIDKISVTEMTPIANADVTGAAKITNVAETTPRSKINADCSNNMSKTVKTSKTNINVTGATKMETTPRTHINVECPTKITNIAGTTPRTGIRVEGPTKMSKAAETSKTNINVTGATKTVNEAGTTPTDNLNVDGPTKITHTVGKTPRTHISVDNQTKLSKAVETSKTKINVTGATKTVNEAGTTPTDNLNVDGPTKITHTVGKTPRTHINVDNQTKLSKAVETSKTNIKVTGATKTVNGAGTTPTDKLNVDGSTKITHTVGKTPRTHISVDNQTKLSNVVKTSKTNTKVTGATKTTKIAGITPKANINVDGQTKIPTKVGTTPRTTIHDTVATNTIYIVEPTVTITIPTAGSSNNNQSKGAMSADATVRLVKRRKPCTREIAIDLAGDSDMDSNKMVGTPDAGTERSVKRRKSCPMNIAPDGRQ